MQRPPLEFFATIQARPIARDLFVKYARYVVYLLSSQNSARMGKTCLIDARYLSDLSVCFPGVASMSS